MTNAEESFARRVAQAELLSELLQHVGYAFWQLSECEDTVAHLVTIRLRATVGMGEEQGEALLAAAQRRTFGSLLRELRETQVLAPELERRMLALLEERNWLVHRSKRESRGVLHRGAAFDRLVSRLQSIAEEATAVNALLAAALEAYVVQAGVDPAFIDREAERLARSWGYV